MSKLKILTIDGPYASGKGSLSRNIAKHLGFKILDSGLLYRTYAYFSQSGSSVEEISNRINNEISFSFNENDVSILHEDKDITSLLRSETNAKIASELSALPKTREDLLTIQRDFYNQDGLVADGRDMGTVVFPKAALKIFLTASPEVRAKRRHLELQKRGQEVNMLDLIADIELRDMKDRTRTLSPYITDY